MHPDVPDDLKEPKTEEQKEKDKVRDFLKEDAKKYKEEDEDAAQLELIKEEKWKKWEEEWKENPK